MRALSWLAPVLLAALMGCPSSDKEEEPPVEICGNGADDDGNGDTDCDDQACLRECVEICDNGEDDDGDGLADCADDDCASPACAEVCDDGFDNDLDGKTDCADLSCLGQCPEDCDDKLDNDGNELIDCYDPVCASVCDADGDGVWNIQRGGEDCDDTDPNISPLAREECDEIDNDCDELIDNEDPSVAPDDAYFLDVDGDGFGDPTSVRFSCTPIPGRITDSADCNDGNDKINPTAVEICNGQDDDCNGVADNLDPGLDTTTATVYYQDIDNDGAGSDVTILACTVPPGYRPTGGDCNDADVTVSPFRAETPCDGVDNDCDPATNDGDTDDDGDGVSECDGDCAPDDPLIYPGNTEITCDLVDNDCDPLTTDSVDADADGFSDCVDCDETDPYVNPGQVEITCDLIDNDCDPTTIDTDPIDHDGDGYTLCQGDCAPEDPLVNPDVLEVTCDGLDNDCDPATLDSEDVDQDGVDYCTDCDDNEPLVSPIRSETVCDGLDNDCDPLTLDDDGSTFDYQEDLDGDGVGAGPVTTTCVPPYPDFAYQRSDDDCDDADPNNNPFLIEICDGVDNDCDGVDMVPCDTGAELVLVGEAAIGVDSYDGFEAATYFGTQSRQVLCEFTSVATDWENSDMAGTPNPIDSSTCVGCDFAFNVRLYDGEETHGDCSDFGLPTGFDDQNFGYGFDSAYPGGPSFMYYYAPLANWYAFNTVPSTYNGVTGEFTYDWSLGYEAIP